MAISSPSHQTQIHIVFVPMLAPGHFIPMIDMAKLLAIHGGIKATIIITPTIAARYNQSSEPSSNSIPISFVQIPFPSDEFGLPEGCETVDTLPSGQWANFGSALKIWQTSVENFIEKMEPLPTCMISDRFIPQVAGIAERLGLKRIIFDGMGCLNLLITHQIEVSKIYETVEESEHFVVPGLPHEIELTKKQIPSFICPVLPSMIEYRDNIKEADRHAYGILINSFEELEPDYIVELQKIYKNRAWCIGPLSLRNKEKKEKAIRGNKAAIDEHECLKWLDNQDSDSVIYACLGSLSKIAPPQLAELGLALEKSNRPFIWVLRATETKLEIEKWMLENKYEERIHGRGLLIWGWAPQVLILSHKAVGGFITHCGWNSTIEGISSGVPMITWPLFGEQFFNEKLVSQILGVGVSVGAKTSIGITSEQTEVEVLVKNEEILEAIEKVMNGDEGGTERRKRAKEMSEAAKKATEEGGSSYHNITMFLQDMVIS
ncbi:UDP-glycosyltransferase 73C4-like [Impatiens glandulifera]|uniref:UDP-glycosyltransferase 73C4-like n=1 Tax=Impatiens glandulifera TaxID=253017 RepID=UPI001FB0F3DD|nr:UDP-glycosyltransferase 73C4-like [Impatiens glandulifera]